MMDGPRWKAFTDMELAVHRGLGSSDLHGRSLPDPFHRQGQALARPLGRHRADAHARRLWPGAGPAFPRCSAGHRARAAPLAGCRTPSPGAFPAMAGGGAHAALPRALSRPLYDAAPGPDARRAAVPLGTAALPGLGRTRDSHDAKAFQARSRCASRWPTSSIRMVFSAAWRSSFAPPPMALRNEQGRCMIEA